MTVPPKGQQLDVEVPGEGNFKGTVTSDHTVIRTDIKGFAAQVEQHGWSDFADNRKRRWQRGANEWQSVTDPGVVARLPQRMHLRDYLTESGLLGKTHEMSRSVVHKAKEFTSKLSRKK